MKKIAWILVVAFFIAGMVPVAHARQDGMTSNLMTLMETVVSNIKEIIDPGSLVGEPMTVEGVTFIPVVKIGFGFGGGGGEGPPDTGYGAGMGAGASIEPVSFLIIQDGRVSLLSAVSSPWKDLIMEILPYVLEGLGGMPGMMMMQDFTQEFNYDFNHEYTEVE